MWLHMQGIQLHVEVMDYDDANGFPHDLVDTFSIDIPSTTMEGFGPILSNTPGQYGTRIHLSHC